MKKSTKVALSATAVAAVALSATVVAISGGDIRNLIAGPRAAIVSTLADEGAITAMPDLATDEASAFLRSLVDDGTLTQAQADALAEAGDREGIRSLVSEGILDPSDLRAVVAAQREAQRNEQLADEDIVASAPDPSREPIPAPSPEGTSTQSTPDEPTGSSSEPEPTTEPEPTAESEPPTEPEKKAKDEKTAKPDKGSSNEKKSKPDKEPVPEPEPEPEPETEPQPDTAPNLTPDEARALIQSLVADGTLTQAQADAIAAAGDREGIRSLVSQGILDPSDLQAIFAALQELQ
jgi:uncharacterized membrane protein YebE (DUF533 family)